MDYYVVECYYRGTPCLFEAFIVKSVSEDMAIDTVMEQRINEINVQRQEANEEYKNMGNEDMLYQIFRRDDLFAFTLDEYMQKYGRNGVFDFDLE